MDWFYNFKKKKNQTPGATEEWAAWPRHLQAPSGLTGPRACFLALCQPPTRHICLLESSGPISLGRYPIMTDNNWLKDQLSKLNMGWQNIPLKRGVKFQGNKLPASWNRRAGAQRQGECTGPAITQSHYVADTNYRESLCDSCFIILFPPPFLFFFNSLGKKVGEKGNID